MVQSSPIDEIFEERKKDKEKKEKMRRLLFLFLRESSHNFQYFVEQNNKN